MDDAVVRDHVIRRGGMYHTAREARGCRRRDQQSGHPQHAAPAPLSVVPIVCLPNRARPRPQLIRADRNNNRGQRLCALRRHRQARYAQGL